MSAITMIILLSIGLQINNIIQALAKKKKEKGDLDIFLLLACACAIHAGHDCGYLQIYSEKRDTRYIRI
jgi:hypothetical protein